MGASPSDQSPPPGRRYAAFLSYSRAIDGHLAPAVQHGLQRFTKAWYEPRALRVFRDSAALAANPDLWQSIEAALGQSEHFILLASPKAKASPWVIKEVEYWLEHRSVDTLLIAVTDGELHWDDEVGDFAAETTCLPSVLSGRFHRAPFWVDLRELREDRLSLDVEAFRDKIAEIAAALHHRPKDDLIGVDLQQHRRNRRLIRTVIATLTVLVVLLAGAATIAVQQRSVAVAQRAATEEQLRAATARLLTAQAEAALGRDPRTAIRLAVAAHAVRPNAETRADLLEMVTATGFTGRVPGHREAVNALAVSPDGTTLASGGNDGMIMIWDLSGPGLPRPVGAPVPSQASFVYALAFAPTGRILATVTERDMIVLWDLMDPSRPRQLSPPLTPQTPRAPAITGFGFSVAFSPDGQTLAAGLADTTTLLWDVSDPATPRQLGRPLVGHADVVRSVAFSPDGRRLATGDDEGTTLLWDIQDRASPRRVGPALSTFDNSVMAMDFSPDGYVLATGHGNGSTNVWYVADPTQAMLHGGRLRRDASFRVFGGDDITSVSFSPDGLTLAAGSTSGALLLWDMGDPSRPRLLDPVLSGPPGIQAVAFLPDGAAVVAGYGDGSLSKWSVRGPARTRPSSPATISYSEPVEAAFLHDGDVLAATSSAGVTDLWAVDRTRSRPLGKVSTDGTYLLAVASAAPIIVTRSGDAATFIDVSDPASPRGRGTIVAGPDSEFLSLVLSRDGRVIASGHRDGPFRGRLVLWDATDPDDIRRVGSVPIEPRDPTSLNANAWVNAVAISPDGRTVATAGFDSVYLWDISNPAQPRHLGPHLPDANGSLLAISPDGHTLATGGAETTLLWDIRFPTQPRLLGQGFGINGPAATQATFSPDGSLLATGHLDAVALWDLTDIGRPRRLGSAAYVPGADMGQISFSRDGGWLVVGDGAGAVSLIDLNPLVELKAHLVERACTYAQGGLDRGDWARHAPGLEFQETCPTG